MRDDVAGQKDGRKRRGVVAGNLEALVDDGERWHGRDVGLASTGRMLFN